MQKTSVYLPETLKQGLADAARRTGRSEADFIRSAIESAVDQNRKGSTVMAEAVPKITGPLLIGVGMGPGPSDLVAARAIASIHQADYVVAGSIGTDAIGRAEAIARAAVGPVRVDRLAIDIADRPERRKQSLDAAADRLVEHLDRGEVVAFLTLGDPNMFSIFPTIADAIRQRRPGMPVTSVPGIMAFQELAARSNVVIAEEGESVRIIAVGRDLADQLGRIDDSVARDDETLVLYRGGRSVPMITGLLTDAKRTDTAVVGELLGQPGERISPATEFADRSASYLACLVAPARRVCAPSHEISQDLQDSVTPDGADS